MRYSERRLRRLLALIRIAFGAMYIIYGYTKLFDLAFYQYIFLPRLSAWQNLVAPWYSWAWDILWAHPHRWELFFGTVEMFIGVALFLGLATRPACMVGILYLFHRGALYWYPEDQVFEFWRFFEIHVEQLGFGAVFLLLGFGHAGDVWGLGALYHRMRLRFRVSRPHSPRYNYFDEERPAPDVEPELVAGTAESKVGEAESP